VACLAAVLTAYKFLGANAAGVTVVATSMLNFMLGRDHESDEDKSGGDKESPGNEQN
jgi:hypothetical protein